MASTVVSIGWRAHEQSATSWPLVSVIVPTRNRAAYLSFALDSVLNQTYPNVEIIVIDDGSTDATTDVLDSYGDRITVIRLSGNGVSAARNHGFRRARGEYIQFLDDDDTLDHRKIEIQIRLLERRKDVDVAYCGYDHIDRLGNLIDRIPAPHSVGVADLVSSNQLRTHMLLIRRSCLDTVGGFDETLQASEDWDLWLRIALAGYTFSGIPLQLCSYRMHADNTLANAAVHDLQSTVVLERAFSNPALPDQLRDRQQEIVANVRQWVSWLYYASGNVEAGKRTLDAAYQLSRDTPASRFEGLNESIWKSAFQQTVGDPVRYTGDVLDNLPDALVMSRSDRDQIMSKVLIGVAARHYAAGEYDVARGYIGRAMALHPTVIDNPELFTRLLCIVAQRLPANEPGTWVKMLLNDLQIDAEQRKRLCREALGGTYCVNGFQHFRTSRRTEALAAMLRAVWYCPRLLANKGVLSVCMKSIDWHRARRGV